MRCLTRNKRTFYYAKYDAKNELIDEYGNKTGQYEVSYTLPISMKANISAGDGATESQPFGNSVLYDKLITVDNANIPIDEYSILWVDTLPTIKSDGTTETPHDYIVKKVARSLNGASIAISKVNVRG